MNSILRRRRGMMGANYVDFIVDGSKIEWEQGSFSSTDGSPTESAYYIRTVNAINVSGKKAIVYQGDTVDGGIQLTGVVYQYDENGDFIVRYYLVAAHVSYKIDIESNCRTVKFVIGKPSSYGVPVLPTKGGAFKCEVKKYPVSMQAWIKNFNTTAGDRIAFSQVIPLVSTRSLTILLDFNVTTNPTGSSAIAGQYHLIYAHNSNLTTSIKAGIAVGKAGNSASVLSVWWNTGTASDFTGTSPAAGRQRIAIMHEAGSNTLTVKYKKDNGSILTKTETRTFVATDDNILYLGNGENGTKSLPTGKINSCEVYDAVLDADAINAFFA